MKVTGLASRIDGICEACALVFVTSITQAGATTAALVCVAWSPR